MMKKIRKWLFNFYFGIKSIYHKSEDFIFHFNMLCARFTIVVVVVFPCAIFFFVQFSRFRCIFNYVNGSNQILNTVQISPNRTYFEIQIFVSIASCILEYQCRFSALSTISKSQFRVSGSSSKFHREFEYQLKQENRELSAEQRIKRECETCH